MTVRGYDWVGLNRAAGWAGYADDLAAAVKDNPSLVSDVPVPGLAELEQRVSAIESVVEPPPPSDIQELIDLGGEQRLPAGEHVIPRAGNNSWGLKLRSDLKLLGPAVGRAVLVREAGWQGDVRMLSTDNVTPIENVHLEGFEIDGKWVDGDPADPADEHQAGIFLKGASDVDIRKVKVRGMPGDAVHVYSDSREVHIDRLRGTDNGRAGVAITGQNIDGVTVDRSYLVQAGSAIDGETNNPGPTADNVSVTRSYLENTADGVAVSAAAPDQNRGWRIELNTIVGGCNFHGSTGLRCLNNWIKANGHPAIRAYYRTHDLLAAGNEIEYTNGGLGKWDYAIVASHNNGVNPGPQTYDDNTIYTASHGMQLWAVNDLHAHHNKLFGSGAGKGIYLRATADAWMNDFDHNQLSGFDEGIRYNPSAGTIEPLTITNHQFRDVTAPLVGCPDGST